MEWIIAVVLAILLGYLTWEEMYGPPPAQLTPGSRKRLCDYYASGSVFEDIPSALKRGARLIELHVYSDERDEPVVAKKALNDGYDYTLDNISFEQCCIDIVNDAFPSKDPLILSIVPHTDKSVVLNRIASHLQTTVRRHLIKDKDIASTPIDTLADKLIVVSGGNIHGTDLEKLVNLSWSETTLRRLTHHQAIHPREEDELTNYNRDNITLVAPEVELGAVVANPNTPVTFGCQWNVYVHGPGGFIEKPAKLQ